MRFYGFGREMTALVDEIESLRQHRRPQTATADVREPLASRGAS